MQKINYMHRGKICSQSAVTVQVKKTNFLFKFYVLKKKNSKTAIASIRRHNSYKKSHDFRHEFHVIFCNKTCKSRENRKHHAIKYLTSKSIILQVTVS